MGVRAAFRRGMGIVAAGHGRGRLLCLLLYYLL
jgi:hypothetical protein